VGLHLCYELTLPAAAEEEEVAALVARLRERVRRLPFDGVSDLVRLTGATLAERPRLRGLAFRRLEDVAHINATFAREELYARCMGIPDDARFVQLGHDIICHAPEIPLNMPAVAYGFAIAVGEGSEPASLGALRIHPNGCERSAWWWHCCCKTQYASVHGDDNLLRCHGALVAALEAAQAVGFELRVRDETGYWESRDSEQLTRNVRDMNRLVASFAGRLTDAVRAAGADSRGIQGEIFKHPDFERLEMPLGAQAASDENDD
jgi:hypothetical protein